MKSEFAGYGRPWAMVFAEAAEILATSRLPRATMAVAFLAIARLSAHGWTTIRHQDWAISLGYSRPTVTRALADLRCRGFIVTQAGRARLTIFAGWDRDLAQYKTAYNSRYSERHLALLWAQGGGVALLTEQAQQELAAIPQGDIPW